MKPTKPSKQIDADLTDRELKEGSVELVRALTIPHAAAEEKSQPHGTPQHDE
jgi:hypothetical protein